MNQFTDIQVIECNRLHSEEAKSNNNENFALWQNNLQDIVHLEPGDRVSVHGAMVSERGAGQANSIEIKGESLGITKTFGTTEISHHTTNASVANKRIDKSDEMRLTYTPVTKEIFDNKGYFVANYFIPANGHNYIDLPRRWWFGEINTGTGVYRSNWTTADNQSKGMSLADPFGMLDTGLPTGLTEPDRWDLYDDYYQICYVDTNASLSKVRKDNSRYTIMVREHTFYSEESASANTSDPYKIPPRYLRTPEHHTYRIYRELKELDFPIGFNTPEFIAEDVTRQMQKVKTTNLFDYRSTQDYITDNKYTPGFPIDITKSISTETYKPFNVAGFIGLSSETDNVPKSLMEEFINASTDLTDGWNYLAQYGVIACKRPELYEYGRLINRKDDLSLALTTGSHITVGTYGDVYHTNLPYNNVNILNDFKNFIQAQEKYPEVFNIFSDPRTKYDDGDNINNCRWVHINRYKNASMTLHPTGTELEQFNTATLGHGGYSQPPWNTNNKPMKSMILPIEYDPNQRDTYYEHPDETVGERTYGCFGRSAANKIIIYGTKNNGSGSALLQAIYDDGVIEEQRKIGFDQHFSAPGMTYLLPSDLRVEDPSQVLNVNDHTLQKYFNGGNGLQTNYDSEASVTVSQLYLGANAPQVGWNGENFTLSGLHTAMNRGNNFFASNPSTTGGLYQYARNNDDSDVVYKINPSEDYCDWSPARKPFVSNYELTGYANPTKTISGTRFNPNLEPWRVYDCLTGIMIEDFGLSETEWQRSIWGLMGFSYKQFHSTTNTRLSVIDFNNINDLSIVTTNSEIDEGDTKIYTQNMWGVPLFYNRLPFGGTILTKDDEPEIRFLPEIIQKTQSISIIAENLPTKMIRGYYTIRSNILQGTPFIGGKVNNTTMPIIGIVNKINGDGDFYFGEESSLVFTITKPLRLASLTTSIHDPDGSYARCSEQSTVLFKVQKNRNVTYNVLQEIIQEEQGQTNQKQRL